MIKLAKYLKPFLAGLIVTVALLFVQAVSDLNLPNYMSEIVNVGIQQSGVEHAAPDALSENGMKLMSAFMSADDKQLVSEHYTLVPATDVDAGGKAYSETYPKAQDRLYVRGDADSAARAELDRAFGAATWTLVSFLRDMGGASASSDTGSMASGEIDIDMAKLYQFLPMLGSLPESALSAARGEALSAGDTMLRQSGVMFAKAFYSELGRDVGAMQTAYIIKIGLQMLAIALVGGAATVLVSFFSSKIAAGVAKNLRRDVFAKVEGFSSAEFDKFSTASLITRCTNDVTQIQMLLMIGIRMICYAPILGIGGIGMAIRKSPSMSWIIAVACVVLAGLMLVVMSITLPKFKLVQKLIDRLNLVSRENLSGMMVIRAFGAQAHEKKRFDGANRDLTGTQLFINRVMVFMMPMMMLIMNGITLVIVWVGAHQILDATMQVGDMMAFMQYAMQIIMSFLMISMMFIFVPRAAISAVRIAEVLSTEYSVVDPEKPKSFDAGKKGLVEFRGVSFRYPGAEEDALSDISFVAPPGKMTAIIGPTGSGKSTIASLMLRFSDATRGGVLVDGADVREVAQKDLRARIGYVPQKGILLSGTVASNLRYGNRDATDGEVETFAAVAQAMEFIREKPEGLEAPIAQGGTNVSGGQKQRLSIARALAKRPEIFIFDDSFSALDFKTDIALRRALKEYTGESTVIVVAQRVGTIMNAEQILVLDDGRIVGRGTHRELLKSCPLYYEIASSQLSEEELA
ncbi:MAG: ABC transporter ATP-binding protein [Bacillota bacterium]